MKNKLKFVFITSTTDIVASTRQRIICCSNYLRSKGYESVINGNIMDADIVVFQKGDPNFIYPLFNKAIISKKFVVFDVDDYDNSQYDYFIKWSDIVCVGSPFLKSIWTHLNFNIFSLDDPVDVTDLDQPLAKYNLQNLKVGWFGNITNLPVLVSKNIQNVTTITVGGDIEWKKETIDQNIKNFDLIVLPQDKSMYGLSKGNCRMLKAIYLGVPVLVSDLPAYIELANFLNYPKEFIVKDNEDWNQKISDIRKNKVNFNFDFNEARQKILNTYSIEARNEIWLKTIVSAHKKRRINFIKRLIFKLLNFYKKTKQGNKRKITLFGSIKITYYKRKEK